MVAREVCHATTTIMGNEEKRELRRWKWTKEEGRKEKRRRRV
jgi:hypothetical protein